MINRAYSHFTQDRLRAQPGYSSVATLSGLQESDYPALSTQSSSSTPALNLPEAAARDGPRLVLGGGDDRGTQRKLQDAGHA